jgi:deoxycytidine triphosphate deaminase
MSFLSDGDLRAAIRRGEIFPGGDELKAVHCSYEFTPGKIFPGADDDGQAVVDWTAGPNADAVFLIRPGALVWIRMKESVAMPPDKCGVWHQTNRLSRQGVMLVNMSSLVDPGYRGPVSGTFVNFGREAVPIRPGDPLAKLAIAELSSPAVEPFTANPESDAKYDGDIHNFAIRGPATFLDLEALDRRLDEEKNAGIKALNEQRTDAVKALNDERAAAVKALSDDRERFGREIRTEKPWAALTFAGLGFVVLLAATSFIPWVQSRISPNVDDHIEAVVQRELANRIAFEVQPSVTPSP